MQKLVQFLRRKSVPPALIGIVACPLLALFFWQDAVDERALIDHAQLVPATLDVVRSGRGGAEGEYGFRMRDGTRGTVRRGYDTLHEIPHLLEVEYLPEKPEVKRIKGVGSNTVGQWRFWLVLKFTFLTVVFSFGVWMLVRGLRNE